eukprot:TRINITY_DN70031_c0_g1_i1.p1 TRINITY_DN70031_c0_g1~~TRINITY_DN70031_c0_g1_i1.p1  ORF type:complete len:349 (-),score=62.99 TRINITY_DN70031_c0_g1_i1:276-1322(-)
MHCRTMIQATPRRLQGFGADIVFNVAAQQWRASPWQMATRQAVVATAVYRENVASLAHHGGSSMFRQSARNVIVAGGSSKLTVAFIAITARCVHSVVCCRSFSSARAISRGLSPRATGVKMTGDPPHDSVKKAKTVTEVLNQLNILRSNGALSLGSLTFGLKRCSRAQCGDSLEAVHEMAKQSGFQLSVIYFTTLMRARSDIKMFTQAKAAWDEMLKRKVTPDETAYVAAFNLCGKIRDRAWAKELWTEVSDRQLASTTTLERRRALISSYLYVHAVCGDWLEVDRLLQHMRNEGIVFDPPLLGQLLHAAKASGSPEKAKLYWDRLVGEGVEPDRMAHRQLDAALAKP